MADVEDNELWKEDAAWLESDISNLGGYEPTIGKPGEMGEGLLVKYISGVGVVIVEE